MSRFSKLELDGTAEATRPRAGKDYLELARRCLREGSHEAALRYFSRVLAEDDKVEEAWLGQLLCLLELGEYREAIAWADRALRLFPDSARLVAAKAVAFGRSGDLDQGLGFSDTSLKRSNVDAFVWWARGDVLISANPQTARHCFEKAGEAARDDWQLLFRVGRSYLSIGQPALARTFFQRAERASGGAAVAWHHLGLACRELGLTEEARQAFEAALAANPGLRVAAEELAVLSRRGPLARLTDALKGLLRRS